MLVKARNRQDRGEFAADINFQQMDAHVLEFDTNQFDHCVVAHTLAVVADPEVVLREIVRVTKPSGLIAIVNHYKDKKGIIGTLWNPFRKRRFRAGFGDCPWKTSPTTASGQTLRIGLCLLLAKLRSKIGQQAPWRLRGTTCRTRTFRKQIRHLHLTLRLTPSLQY